MKTNLLTALLIYTAISSNAIAAVSSGTTPLGSGPYTHMSHDVCTAESINPLPANIPTSYNESSVYISTFSFDKTHTGATSSAAFANWTAYLGTLGVTIPVGFFKSLADPSSPNLNLSETPIQWGTHTQTGLLNGQSLPYTSFTPVSLDPNNEWVIITSFNYAVPANNNNVTVGYIANVYDASAKTWIKIYFYPNLANTPVTSGAALRNFVQTRVIGAASYKFDCLGTTLFVK